MLTDAELTMADATSALSSIQLGDLLREVREYRALRPFAQERLDYPMATWGEKELARLVIQIGR